MLGVNRASTISLLISFVSLWWWTYGPAKGLAAPQPCEIQGAKCVYDKLNFSADGLLRLRTSQRDLSQVFQVDVRLLISPYPDGVLLQLVSNFVQEVVYEKYYERILRIPPGATLTALTLRKALPLQAVAIAAPNNYLTVLQIKQSNLRSIPEAFINLPQLATLSLQKGALESVSLDPLANSPELTVLLCSNNKVTRLIASQNKSLLLPLSDFSLANNLLETIDGAFFQPLHTLTYLDLGSNRIQRITDRPFSLPRVSYIQLVENQLRELDMSRWNMPRLQEIFFDNNNLTRIPIGIEKLPNLTALLLPKNLLTVVDLRRFNGWTNLQRISFASNRINKVMVSGAGRITLPNLVQFDLSENVLSQLEYARWDLPSLSTLAIAFNQLQRLPDLFKIFPKLKRVYGFKNPFLCSTIRQWQQYITQYMLSVDTTTIGKACTTNSTFTLPSGRVVCCVE